MESITLKEIAGYLPYQLEVMITESTSKGEIHKLSGINYDGLVSLGGGGRFGFIQRGFNQFKPLLYPLSMLTQQIEHNGEKFIMAKEHRYLRFEEISNYKGGSRTLDFIQSREKDLLMEFNFDFYGLIERGLAIDKSKI